MEIPYLDMTDVRAIIAKRARIVALLGAGFTTLSTLLSWWLLSPAITFLIFLQLGLATLFLCFIIMSIGVDKAVLYRLSVLEMVFGIKDDMPLE